MHDSDPDSAPASTRRVSFEGRKNLHGPRLSPDGNGAELRVWAPDRARVELVLVDRSNPPVERRRCALEPTGDGFHVAFVDELRAGDRYFFAPEPGRLLPDPASRFQPLGVHGPSELVDPASFRFREEGFAGCPLEDLVIYELHVGTATREGTFRALIERLDHVRALGATAIELMPIGDFPGERNWGYDGVCPFAPARCYGRPEDLVALIDAAHARGLAVLLDVVYNHLGPDGNYLAAWTRRFFDETHPTPWGPSLAYHEPAVRAWLCENAEQWIRDYRFDGLRLDATHAMHDQSARHVLSELAERARAAASQRDVLVIAEDERNDARLVTDASRGGVGLDAVWADDFHHEVRRLIAGDHEGHFADFAGTVPELVRILERGWLYEGQRAVSHGRPRGTSAAGLAPPKLVFCIQNHDQVGNRATGDRLHHATELARVRAAVVLLLSLPYTPLLFMGQEIAASSPFAYFTDHHEGLGRLVTDGRRAEFARFSAFSARAIPDPQARSTFEASRIDWSEGDRPVGREMFELHRALLRLRREEPAMAERSGFTVAALPGELVAIRRSARLGDPLLFIVGLRAGGDVDLRALEAPDDRAWTVELASAPASRSGDVLTLGGPSGVVLRARPRPR